MPIPYLHRTQRAQYPIGRSDPDARSEKLTGEVRQGIITGIIFIGGRMLSISGKIIGGRLGIPSIERRHGKERSDLIRNFDTGGMRHHTPAVRIKSVVAPDNNFIP